MKVYQTYDHEVFSTLTTTPENSPLSSVTRDHVDMEGLDDVCRWLCDDDDDLGGGYVQEESTELDSQAGIKNLLMAYAEAIEMEQHELAKVIVKCISEKASPNGSPLERIALSLFGSENQEKTYLFQESLTNFNLAFRAFYDIFPYSRFAHFTTSSAIIEAVPAHVDSVHIIDFDICEGIQWPPVIEAMARITKSLIITSIKLDQDQDSNFDKIRWHLCNFASSVGLDLKVQEMGMSQMLKKMDERNIESEFNQFVVFNCMIGLLHMRTRKTTQVIDFIKLARNFLTKHQGIITFGGGLEVERTKYHSNFSSFFNMNLAYNKALYESMEWGIPSYLNEARIAMETLFLAPCVSSKSWFGKWDERQRENSVFEMNFEKGFGLKGERMSMESWNEAMEMVKEGESPYRIRIEGGNGNEMVLEWKETPLLAVGLEFFALRSSSLSTRPCTRRTWCKNSKS
ncbi:protein NODULATION SIGNALING PATHWAY 2-like [Bidens hawaiensis]|uniref:protein NODULATION SIGNALING PATHWAY 2-like n=1 Tax=Bidens hawaiensis TaxID=980011 RepID=UPI0040494342